MITHQRSIFAVKVLLLATLIWTVVFGVMPTPGAHAATYGPTRWAYHTVYVEDHTGWAWPVWEAAGSWDYGTDVSVRYGVCRSGAGCIRVYEGYYGGTGWWGNTALVWYPSTGVITRATVRLNDSYLYAMSAHQRRTVVCHEEGHGLGLPHQNSTSSCLYPVAYQYTSAYPNWVDRARLNLRY